MLFSVVGEVEKVGGGGGGVLCCLRGWSRSSREIGY